jgi:hypothetical protein
MEVPLLGQHKPEPAKTPEVVEARCAFLVYITKGGQTVMTPDINTPLTVERPIHQDEALGATYNVLTNLSSQMGAAMTINGMVGMTQAAMQQQAQQQLLKDPNLRVRG